MVAYIPYTLIHNLAFLLVIFRKHPKMLIQVFKVILFFKNYFSVNQ